MNWSRIAISWKTRKNMNEIVSIDVLQQRIFTIRNKRVIIDRDLAELYGVKTYRLNEAVKRNIKRFPTDFMFKLNASELKELIANCDRFQKLKHSSNMPNAFTEQGVAMLSTVLNSEVAININIQIMRAFVQMQKLTIEHKDLQEQIFELKKYFIQYAKDNNEEIERINQAINLLMDRTKPTKVGF